jgi:hypothetical protein
MQSTNQPTNQPNTNREGKREEETKGEREMKKSREKSKGRGERREGKSPRYNDQQNRARRHTSPGDGFHPPMFLSCPSPPSRPFVLAQTVLLPRPLDILRTSQPGRDLTHCPSLGIEFSTEPLREDDVKEKGEVAPRISRLQSRNLRAMLCHRE